MIGIIIYLIIIGLIIRKVLKDKKVAKRASSARNKPAQAYQSQAKTAYQTQQQMRDLKHRLEKKYKSAPRPMKENQKKENSILQSAKENVAENNIDFLKEADKKWHETAKTSLPDPGEDTDSLKQVYDLMTMGYSGNLYFERDFLSESMDMINRMGMAGSSVEMLDFSAEGKL
ncbi:MAG: hypothetical protein NC307_08580 [Roseburia sp.]|nr:hypothetical protein [Roseburia sp.]